jgi:hypothetical protein
LKKLQQFFILKFQSDRLKKSNFNINITLDNAKINSEVITINNSELLRALFRYKHIKYDQNALENLLILQKRLRKAENTEKNRIKLIETTENIEKLLFVEDLISIQFKHKSHYLNILKRKGFYVNGIKFVPFMASSGMIRRNTALFINNNIKHELMDILENDRDENVPMVNAKFGAYFSLYSSSTLPVSFPKFAVVADKHIETIRKVDFVTYKGIDEDDEVVEKEYTIKANAWDGQGLMTPRLALRWSDELELDYTFSCCIIRAPFTKGLVTVFDLDAFANKIAGKRTFIDIYGDEINIGDVDLIISESMFKLSNAYKNTQDFIDKCNKNQLGFSIAKVNQKKEKSHSRTSYQFLQVLNLNDWDIANLCEPTINWFRDISGNSPENMLLYATGEHEFDLKEFKKLDIAVKAILLNPTLSRDKYIQNRFIKTISKKKKESYMGSILINANYQFMIADPFYQACHIFNVEHEPLLKDGEHYSEYWLDKGITKIGAIRSPIVHHSEFNILDLQERQDTRKWFQHIHSGIIFPANGIGMDCAIHGGADFDGDLICTINNATMLKGKTHGTPIVYESQKANVTIVDSRDDKSQVESQLNGYNSKVGFATNISSSMYTMLEEFPMGSDEQEAILKRLKIGRVIQGEIIDGVKGLQVPPFRDHWTKYKKITPDMTPDEIAKWEFNNKILCKVRPAFFRFLYPHYMTRYNKEIKKYNIYSHLAFKKSFGDILKSRSRTEEEQRMVDEYKERSFFLDNNSTVNRISRYMRANVGLIGKYSTKTSRDFDYTILQNQNNILTQENITRMNGYLQEYKTFKKTLRNNLITSYANLDVFISYLRKQCVANISTNEAELADYAIEVTYGGEVGMCEFPWKLFPEGLLDNIIQKTTGIIKMPIQDDLNGNIEYLWNKYSIKEFELGDLYEN